MAQAETRVGLLVKQLREEAVSDRECELHNTADWHEEIADVLEKLVQERDEQACERDRHDGEFKAVTIDLAGA